LRDALNAFGGGLFPVNVGLARAKRKGWELWGTMRSPYAFLSIQLILKGILKIIEPSSFYTSARKYGGLDFLMSCPVLSL
jgi:hypothetical protein